MTLIIFDCDGVLVDSEVIACRVDARCLSACGFPTDCGQVMERYLGRPLTFMMEDIERRHGRPLPKEFPQYLRSNLIDVFTKDLMPVDGIQTLLGGLQYPCCVASSSDPELLSLNLQLTGLHHCFAPNIFSTTMVKRGKPAPDLFLLSARQMGVEPDMCLVVEDSPSGLQAAKAAGMRAIGFLGGSHRSSADKTLLLDAGADVVAETCSDLTEILMEQPLGNISPNKPPRQGRKSARNEDD